MMETLTQQYFCIKEKIVFKLKPSTFFDKKIPMNINTKMKFASFKFKKTFNTIFIATNFQHKTVT